MRVFLFVAPADDRAMRARYGRTALCYEPGTLTVHDVIRVMTGYGRNVGDAPLDTLGPAPSETDAEGRCVCGCRRRIGAAFRID